MKNVNLKRLQPAYIRKMKAFMYHHDLNKQECADRIGQNYSIFCDLMNEQRELSALYLLPAIQGGAMTAKEIYDKKPETEKEKKFWARQILMENDSLVDAASEFIEAGGDPVEFLKMGAIMRRSQIEPSKK
jgi:hypothetical protein